MGHTVAFYVFADFQLLDLSGPLSVFQLAAEHAPGAYRLQVISVGGGLVRSTCGLQVATAKPPRRALDTLVIAGGEGARALAADAAATRQVSRLAARSRRVASVCTGAFLLAGAGLLNGRRAATHWRYADVLQRRYPAVKVDADRIFVNDGGVWSSAGISAGIDLALALVEDDLGMAAARAVAREMVLYHRRAGGQSQFSTLLELEPPSDRIRRALQFAREHLHERLPVERLAAAASLSPRQFGRLFQAETGSTPSKAVERLRVEAARARVETTTQSLQLIARELGFVEPERMRQSFLRAFGQPPQALRRAARR